MAELFSQVTLTDDEVKEAFNLFDTDRSGSIDASEIGKVLKSMGRDVDEVEVEKLMSQMDKDGSGVIEFDEFDQLLKRQWQEDNRTSFTHFWRPTPLKPLEQAYKSLRPSPPVQAAPTTQNQDHKLVLQRNAEAVEEALFHLLLDLNPKIITRPVDLHLKTAAHPHLSTNTFFQRRNFELSTLKQETQAHRPWRCNRQMRQRLIEFYERYDADRLSTVVETLREFAGNEEALFAALVKKYGPEPPRVSVEAALLKPLPDGWAFVETETGEIFYRHTDGRNQWHRPFQLL